MAPSLILCDALRSISKESLGDRPLGTVSTKTMQRVESILRLLMKL